MGFLKKECQRSTQKQKYGVCLTEKSHLLYQAISKARTVTCNLIALRQERRLRQEMYDRRFGIALFLKLEYTEHCDTFFGPIALEK